MRPPLQVAILYLLERLKREAAAAGGALHVLNGNHETMNVSGRFRYASPGGLADFAEWHATQRRGAGLKARCGLKPGACATADLLSAALAEVAPAARPRVAALAPVALCTSKMCLRRSILPTSGC